MNESTNSIHTTIHSNGSKWAGEAPDSIETLLEVLATHKLDQSRFEGGFVTRTDSLTGTMHYLGNFDSLSHGFRIDSNDPEVVRPLVTAIVRNVLAHRDHFKPNRFRAYFHHSQWGRETYETFGTEAGLQAFCARTAVTRTTVDPEFSHDEFKAVA